MQKLSDSGLLNRAFELTTVAMENSMIKTSSDPKETAKNVVDFYHTVLTTLNSED